MYFFFTYSIYFYENKTFCKIGRSIVGLKNSFLLIKKQKHVKNFKIYHRIRLETITLNDNVSHVRFFLFKKYLNVYESVNFYCEMLESY